MRPFYDCIITVFVFFVDDNVDKEVEKRQEPPNPHAPSDNDKEVSKSYDVVVVFKNIIYSEKTFQNTNAISVVWFNLYRILIEYILNCFEARSSMCR